MLLFQPLQLLLLLWPAFGSAYSTYAEAAGNNSDDGNDPGTEALEVLLII